jgi:hypothetical protein
MTVPFPILLLIHDIITDIRFADYQAISVVLLQVYGSPNTWTTSTIQSLGSIVQGLTSTELDTMTFTYDDIAALGAFDGWEDSQVYLPFKIRHRNLNQPKLQFCPYRVAFLECGKVGILLDDRHANNLHGF